MTEQLTLRGSAPAGNRHANDYAIGYGKPPQATRFRPGQSGNPRGRHKGVRNLATDVKRTLKLPVKVNEGNGSRKISTQAGMLMLLREKALKGDPRALDRLIDLSGRYNNESNSEAMHSMSSDDEAILAAFAKEIVGASTPCKPQWLEGLKPRPTGQRRAQ
jgi:hypothetical protein